MHDIRFKELLFSVDSTGAFPPCIAAMKTLTLAIENSEEDTMMGVHTELKRVTTVIKEVASTLSLNLVSTLGCL